jgi:hypothetical protein
VAERVCGHARAAAEAVLRAAVTVHVADSDPADVECVLHSGALRVDVVAEASPQAWVEFDTTESHQDQVYGPGGVHEPSQIPKNESQGRMLAGWIPAKNELFATNGSPTRGGSYVTVMVTRGAKGGRSATGSATRLRVAREVALATLAVAPRGPSPGGS